MHRRPEAAAATSGTASTRSPTLGRQHGGQAGDGPHHPANQTTCAVAVGRGWGFPPHCPAHELCPARPSGCLTGGALQEVATQDQRGPRDVPQLPQAIVRPQQRGARCGKDPHPSPGERVQANSWSYTVCGHADPWAGPCGCQRGSGVSGQRTLSLRSAQTQLNSCL